MKYAIIGVIGHIDHGKTSLVAALTGIDVDTHPEEKRRGITIDLGFASFETGNYQFALIDAPGHQKYVGNMLAGVSNVDIGLLVVACDQGIQKQTLEHASILRLLGVERIVVALTRSDLASHAVGDELHEELELFLDDIGFRNFPVVPVSSLKRIGLEELEAELCRVADGIPTRLSRRYFRMPVDRVFTSPGRGCIVAGTIWSGTIRVGDVLQIAGTATTTRVRKLEVHGQSVESSITGTRTAVNLTGVSSNQVRRGDELLQLGVFRTVEHSLVELEMLPSSPEIRCPATVQMHVATNTCSGRLIGVRRLSAGSKSVVIVETENPLIVEFGQRCLFRLPHPVGTFAGGRILAALDRGTSRIRRLIEFGKRLAISDAGCRLVAWVDFIGEVDPAPAWCELQVGIPTDINLPALINELVSAGSLLTIPGCSRLFSPVVFKRIGIEIKKILAQQAGNSPSAWRVEDSLVEELRRFGTPILIRAVFQSLLDGGSIIRLKNMIAIATPENTLSRKQKARIDEIMAIFENNRAPPLVSEVAEGLNLPVETVTSFSRFAIQSGILTDVGNGLYIATDVLREMCSQLHREFAGKSKITVAEIRDLWQVTRKHAIPLLEYCDKMKITTRTENSRSAGPGLPQFLSLSQNHSEVSVELRDIYRSQT